MTSCQNEPLPRPRGHVSVHSVTCCVHGTQPITYHYTGPLPVSCDQSQQIPYQLYTMDGFLSCHSLYTIVLLAVLGQGSHMIQTGPITANLYHVIRFAQSQLD
ncbi:unnamed protein product [Staurois parvus]|uniref:Uncharacterized protein n=1 Tax=Staurois parvus TaxID=386267 RepID=A0ABN9BR79_9NEOB|nr:unnamed protein product [Staurois parvus]